MLSVKFSLILCPRHSSLLLVLASILVSILVFRPCFYPRSTLVFRPCFYPRSILVLRPRFCPCFSPCILSLLQGASILCRALFCPRSYSCILSVLRPRLSRKSSCERAAALQGCRNRELFFGLQHSRLVACDLTSVLRSLRTRSELRKAEDSRSASLWRTLAQPRAL